MPPLLMSFARFLVAGSLLFALTARGRRPTLSQWAASAIAGAALLGIGTAGVAWAETRIESGLAALIVAVIPLYVALFDRVFFGRRLSPLATCGLLVGFAGVALLLRPGGTSHVGAALILLATTSAWAAGSLYARGAPVPENPLLAASMQMRLDQAVKVIPLGVVMGLLLIVMNAIHNAWVAAPFLLNLFQNPKNRVVIGDPVRVRRVALGVTEK